MHRLIETTFRESLVSNRRCFWLSRTDAIKPVTTTTIPHHLPKFFSPPAQVPPWTYLWTRPALLRTGAAQEQDSDHGHTAKAVTEQCWTQPLVPSHFLKCGLLTKKEWTTEPQVWLRYHGDLLIQHSTQQRSCVLSHTRQERTCVCVCVCVCVRTQLPGLTSHKAGDYRLAAGKNPTHQD